MPIIFVMQGECLFSDILRPGLTKSKMSLKRQAFPHKELYCIVDKKLVEKQKKMMNYVFIAIQ